MLAEYDRQLRAHVPDRLPPGVELERDGPLVRFLGLPGGGFVEYQGLDGVDGADLDALIARQVQVFAARGERFEWKLHGHDRPSDLAERLRAAGFVPEETETVVVGAVADIASEPVLPDGVTLREVVDRVDLDRIAGLEKAVWDEDHTALADMLEGELAVEPGSLAIVVAEAGATVVCAGWVRFPERTDFATLWGGSTLPEWRGRGIYRGVVAHRANLAARRRIRYLETDASDDSRPILERLGFTALTTTTPFIWSPGSALD